MAILFSSGTEATIYPVAHDPNSKRYYKFIYRPSIRQDSAEYYLDDVVILPTSNGLYYICVNPGISAATIPTFKEVIKTITTDGTVKWKAIAYNINLKTGDSIATAAEATSQGTVPSQFILSSGVTSDNEGYDTTATWLRIIAAPSNVSSIEITNRVLIKRSNGAYEQLDNSIIIPIEEL